MKRGIVFCGVLFIGVGVVAFGVFYLQRLTQPLPAETQKASDVVQETPEAPSAHVTSASASSLDVASTKAKDSAVAARHDSGEAMILKAKLRREENTARFQEQIDFIRKNPDHPDREKVLDSIIDESLARPFVYEEAGYLVLEKHKYELARGRFSWLYVESAVRHYQAAGRYELAFACLDDAIEAVETGQFAFDVYRGVAINSPEARAAVVEDLKAKKEELRRLVAGERASTPASVPAPVLPGEIVDRPNLTPEETTQTEKAKQALLSHDYDAAVAHFESIGDRENAAAAMLNKTRGASADEAFSILEDVTAKYPDTVQAKLVDYCRAQSSKQAGKQADYIRYLKDFVAHKPDSPLYGDALIELSTVAQAQGQPEDAIGYLEQYLEYQRHSEKSLSLHMVDTLTMLYEDLGYHDRADKLLSESLEALERDEVHVPGGQGSELRRINAIQQLRQQQIITQQMREIRKKSN